MNYCYFIISILVIFLVKIYGIQPSSDQIFVLEANPFALGLTNQFLDLERLIGWGCKNGAYISMEKFNFDITRMNALGNLEYILNLTATNLHLNCTQILPFDKVEKNLIKMVDSPFLVVKQFPKKIHMTLLKNMSWWKV